MMKKNWLRYFSPTELLPSVRHICISSYIINVGLRKVIAKACHFSVC